MYDDEGESPDNPHDNKDWADDYNPVVNKLPSHPGGAPGPIPLEAMDMVMGFKGPLGVSAYDESIPPWMKGVYPAGARQSPNVQVDPIRSKNEADDLMNFIPDSMAGAINEVLSPYDMSKFMHKPIVPVSAVASSVGEDNPPESPMGIALGTRSLDAINSQFKMPDRERDRELKMVDINQLIQENMNMLPDYLQKQMIEKVIQSRIAQMKPRV